jgi:hypothetical protein
MQGQRVSGQIIRFRPRQERNGIAGWFFCGMSLEHRRQRILELEAANVPPQLIARLTDQIVIPWGTRT